MNKLDSQTNFNSNFILIQKLCSKLTGLSGESLTEFVSLAQSSLVCCLPSFGADDEFRTTENIKKQFVNCGRERDAARFSELYRRLQSQFKDHHRVSVLQFLANISSDRSTNKFSQGLSVGATSTPFYHRSAPKERGDQTLSFPHDTIATGSSSGISSINSRIRSVESHQDSSLIPHSLLPSDLRQPSYSVQADGVRNISSYKTPFNAARLHKVLQKSNDTTVKSEQPKRNRINPYLDTELSEAVILRELLSVFQGVEGKYLKLGKDGFILEPQECVAVSQRRLIYKLAECGWLFNRVKRYTEIHSKDRASGLVGQSFCAALHQELTEYYRLIAVLESQLEQQQCDDLDLERSSDGGSLTLHRLQVWMHEPMLRLKALASLVDISQNKRGGALATEVHSYMKHGDPVLRAIVKNILTSVAKPICSTITSWIYDGVLDDSYHEFFVASNPLVKDDRLWHDKYDVRSSMVPSFLTINQARKILLTGKSINYLQQVCHDRTRIHKTSDDPVTLNVESIFQQSSDGSFDEMVESVYKETSSHLLHVLYNDYKFLDHLKAMRRYFLFGQGDFIRHLMDLLEEDLAKPASKLYHHNLSGILETSIRATNAQYDDPDILKRLDHRLLEVSPGDTGWDVFSLDYIVDGPIRTVFSPDCMLTYLRAFNFLWRAKRMEYVLAGVWKAQMANVRQLRRSLPELAPVLHQCNILCNEMVFFIQQMQYYINFEVLECSWGDLVKKVGEAPDLDHIIAAHNEFLTAVISRSLLDTNSKAILAQLRTIFDLIIKFQSIQDSLYAQTSEELLSRDIYEKRKTALGLEGKWSTDKKTEAEELSRRESFVQDTIPSIRSKLRVLAQSYQNMTQQFLVMLVEQNDTSLSFLSFRLDFNEYYRAREPKLQRTPNRIKRSKIT